MVSVNQKRTRETLGSYQWATAELWVVPRQTSRVRRPIISVFGENCLKGYWLIMGVENDRRSLKPLRPAASQLCPQAFPKRHGV